MGVIMKHCSGCDTDKDEADFNRGQGWCRECQRKYRQEHAAEKAAYNRAYTAANRDKQRQWVKECDERHKLERKRAKQLYYVANKETILARNAEWKASNRERFRVYEGTRRCLEHNWGGDLTSSDWLQVLNAHGGKCAYCGSTDRIELEHMTPLSRGGQHTKSNIVPACFSCNRSKGAMTADEFREFRLKYLVPTEEPIPETPLQQTNPNEPNPPAVSGGPAQEDK